MSTSEAGVIEALEGTSLSASPRGQLSIPLRIRAGESGIARSQAIASVVLSDTTITIRDETNLRVRDVFRSPASLLKFQTFVTNVILVAPSRVGDYTFSIGTIPFELSVTPSSRMSANTGVLRLINRRTNALEERKVQFAERRTRHAPLNPDAPQKKEARIRIKLTSTQESAILLGSSPMKIEGAGHLIQTEGSVHVNREEHSCKVSSGNGQFFADVIRITPVDPRGILTFTNMDRQANRFRGTLECHILNGTVTWINELSLEDYLAGLAEEPDSEPYEKQRAFAIAARSYALYYVISEQRKFPGLPYDGSDSPREFQAYGGVLFEEGNPRWVEAVRSTASQVLTWQRQVLKAPYFSSDNGRTRSALEVWGWQTTPYLDAKDDPWCLGMMNSGHGVGMSGCGAEGQANEGKTAEEILQYYYPGTKITTYDPETYGK